MPAVAKAPPVIGPEACGPYRVVRELGRGGMGAVYLARHPARAEEVALKVLHGLEGSQRQRFLREVRALRQLAHPGLIQVFDAGSEGLSLWCAMRYCPGGSLEDRLRARGPLRVDEALSLGLQLCAALGAAHAAGVIHRDLKPANILCDGEGRFVVTDFGLVKSTACAESQRLTRSGALQGTPGYWAPEQARGLAREASVATDVYGVGAVLYAVLSGRPPFRGESLIEVVVATLERPPDPLALQRGDVPKALERALLRCLEKDPAARFPDLAALAAELRRVGDARESSSDHRAASAGRGRLGLALTVGVGALVLSGLGLALVLRAGAPAETAQASPSAPASPSAAASPAAEPRPETPLEEAARRYRPPASLRLATVMGDLSFKVRETRAVGVLADGRRAVSCSRALDIWDLSTGRRLATTSPRGPDGALLELTDLVVLPGDRVATTGAARLVWSLAKTPLAEAPRLATRLPSPPVGAGGRVSASARGERVLFWNEADGARVFDATTWAEVGRVPSAAGSTSCVLAADGRAAYFGRADGTLEVAPVDRPEESPRRLLAGRGAGVRALAPTANGARLLIGDEAGAVRVLDLSLAEVVGEARVEESAGTIALSPDGRRVAVAAHDGINPSREVPPRVRTVHLFSLGPRGSLSPERVLRGHRYFVADAAFSPDGARLLTAAWDDSLRLWDATSGECVLAPQGHVSWVVEAAVSPEGSLLATAGFDGALRLWDAATGAPRGEFLHPWNCVTLAFSADGRRLASCGREGEVVVFEVGPSGLRETARRDLQGKVTGLTQVGARIVAVTLDGALLVWDPERPRFDPVRLTLFDHAAASVAALGGDAVLVGTQDLYLARLNLDAGTQPPPISVMSGPRASPPVPFVRHLSVAGEVAGWVSMGGQAGFLRLDTRQRVLARRAQGGWTRGIALDPTGRRAATTSDDATLCLWRTADGTQLDVMSFDREGGESPAAVAFAPDGRRLYVGTIVGAVLAFDLAASRR
ncbi:MAG: protein kinase [Planctomycetota bacterium]